jgi:hypothetical protein
MLLQIRLSLFASQVNDSSIPHQSFERNGSYFSKQDVSELRQPRGRDGQRAQIARPPTIDI